MAKPSNTLAYLVLFGTPGEPNFRIESVHTDRAEAQTAVDNHPHANSKITRKRDMPRIIDIDLGLLAWDISDAFAKTEEYCLDFGMDEIAAALPAFITAIITYQG